MDNSCQFDQTWWEASFSKNSALLCFSLWVRRCEVNSLSGGRLLLIGFLAVFIRVGLPDILAEGDLSHSAQGDLGEASSRVAVLLVLIFVWGSVVVTRATVPRAHREQVGDAGE